MTRNSIEFYYSNEVLSQQNWLVELFLEVRVLGKGLLYWHFVKIYNPRVGEWFRGNTLKRSDQSWEWSLREALGFEWRRFAKWD